MPKELPPIRIYPDEYRAVEQIIVQMLQREIYLPLLKLLKAPKRILNAPRDLETLLEAIQSGRISHAMGSFTGRFSGTISRQLKALGASWDPRAKAWRITLRKLPLDVRAAISVSEARFNETLRKIDERLAEQLPKNIADLVKIQRHFDKTVWKVTGDVDKTLKGIATPPKLTPEGANRIASDYTQNLDLYIRKFSDKQIVELRKKVQQKAFQGYRYEGLVKMIQQNYGVTQTKAKFLARQETNLLMTKVKEIRYTEASVHEYKWVCVHMPHDKSPNQHTPGNVRYFHGQLNGSIFRWDTPPVTNSKGQRNNPGQDFNCRCVARPVVKF